MSAIDMLMQEHRTIEQVLQTVWNRWRTTVPNLVR